MTGFKRILDLKLPEKCGLFHYIGVSIALLDRTRDESPAPRGLDFLRQVCPQEHESSQALQIHIILLHKTIVYPHPQCKQGQLYGKTIRLTESL